MRDQIYGYHILDSRQIKEKIQNKIINVTITSPPYWRLKNYDSENQIGYGQSYENYLNDLVNIFDDIHKVTKENGSLWIVIDTFKQNKEIKLLPFDLSARLKEIGWQLQDIIIWAKNKNLPWSHKGKLRNIYEYILFFSKSDNFRFFIDRIKEPKKIQNWWIRYPERYNPKGKAPERLWEFSIPTQGSWSNGWIKHFCPFPPKLVERIVLLTTNRNDTVLDPFAGSGIVLAQSIAMGRRAIGFDINSSYKDMYEKKVFPYIQSEWKKRQKELMKRQKDSIRFSTTIKILRQLKYPKLLLKYAIKKGILDFDSVRYIFLRNDKKSMRPKIFFIFKNNSYSLDLSSQFEEIMSRPPLSKFGIAPRIEIIKGSNLMKFLEETFTKTLFIYDNGVTHSYKHKISLSKWVEQNEKAMKKELRNKIFPQIISDTGIRVYLKNTPNIKRSKI
jgi:DNA modification methylase